MLLLIISVIFQTLVIYGNPFDSSSNNSMTVFNEISISCYLYLMLCLTDFWDIKVNRNLLGWALLYILVCTLVINFLKALICDFISSKNWLYSKIRNKTKKYAN